MEPEQERPQAHSSYASRFTASARVEGPVLVKEEKLTDIWESGPPVFTSSGGND